MVELRGLTRKFGDFVAVNNLHLQVSQGTIFGFLGPNGAGKSTTVKMLTGVLRPTAGDALIDGLSIQTSPLEIKQKIGVLPEDLALFDSLTIWEHLKMCGAIYRLSNSETETRAEQLLNYLDLWTDRHTFVEQSSYGMKKKCALAMVLIHHPKVLFSRAQAKATIADNDPPPAVSIGDVSIQEGDTGTKTANLTVSLSKASGKAISVQYATADSTAFAGTDYVATAGTLNFAPGETQKVVAVMLNGDTFFETDETFFVNLTNPVDATLADAQGVGTIANDDTLKLIIDESGPSANQATALESVLLVRDPFHVLSIAHWLNLGSDRNTRVTVFSNLQLSPGEAVSIVTVNLLDSSNQSFDVPAEDVRALFNTSFTQVTFRLPNILASGVVQVTIKVRGHTSNTGTVRIVP